MYVLWCSLSTACFLILIFSPYNCPDNHYAELLGFFFQRVVCFVCMHKKVCVHNTSKNIFRLHPIPYISCVLDSATSELSAMLFK